MIRSLMLWLSRMFGTGAPRVPGLLYTIPLPPERLGNSGVPAARRAARKRRNQRRARRA